MKLPMLFLAVLSVCITSLSQTPNVTSEQLIDRVLATGAYDGITDKRLSGMGDAAAMEVTKVLGSKLANGQTLTTFDIENVLLIFHLAFAGPPLAVNVPDREPKASLFVLDSLMFFTTDALAKKSIGDTKQFLLNQSRK